MSKEKLDFDTKIITPVFRLSYPNLFKPSYNKLAKREEYTITMLFDKKTSAVDLKGLKELAQKVAIAKFGAKPGKIKSPFRDGDTEISDQTGELKKFTNPSIDGMIYIRSWSKFPPGIVDAARQPIIAEDEIYGGCYCRAQLNCYAYDQAGNRGVSFGLLHIQKVKDGDPFGSRTRPEDAFSSVEGATESLAENNDELFS